MELTHRTIDLALVPASGNEGVSIVFLAPLGFRRSGHHASPTLVLQTVALARDLHDGGRSSDTQFGWTVGAGGEFLLSSNITVRAEYLYVDLGDGGAVTAIATTPTPGLAAASFKTTFNDVDFHTVRLGINFKLGSDCCATARK